MIPEEITTKEQHERALAMLRKRVDDKREDEQKTIKDYKKDPKNRASVAELDRKNAD